MDKNTHAFIENIIKNNDVVLFMKGTSSAPQCGFSNVVCKILNYFNVEFKDINVLENNDIRQGIKEYSDWPTIPQLYIKSEFIGGCDIIREMYDSGEFKTLLEKHDLTKKKIYD
ncbi:MAG: Grx4 family monothiol glutaredoxin [Rickettsiales bacterium]|nr:Grx4 family monothiol glutaredoxin [Rickettsiales bacterium]